jgi:peptidoglycan-N-acetylglucosamine deacetylase
MNRLITTSWDDGHPKDIKIASLLEKYNLPGTFYIPKTNTENSVMDENCIYELSKKFEIGGHTLTHVRLYNKSDLFLDSEIGGCFNWLKTLLGNAPVSFCFPGGVLTKAAVRSATTSGFKVMRTTELLSTINPLPNNLIPTTLQIFQHQRISYIKNTIKRNRYKSMLHWMGSSCSKDILKLTDYYLDDILKKGGCFHLWGHSWEIEEYNLWNKLNEILNHISNLSEFKYIQNKDMMIYKN